MRLFKLITILALTSALAVYAEGAVSDTLPDKATLSANRMRFDSQTGDFLADGNVTIAAGGLTVAAPRGTGNIERREVLFDEGIAASGDWMGDPVSLKAGKLALSFAEDPTCRFQEGVKGGVGAMSLDADRLTLIGLGGLANNSAGSRQTKFWLVKVRSLEDRSKGITFGADTVEGVLRDGELHTLTADKGVWLRGRPKKGEEAVNLRGNHALYSLDRGSVVLSGNVSAVQGGRTLRSNSIVYFPEQNRVEAIGGVPGRSASPNESTGRAEITIDLSREKLKKTAPAKEKEPSSKKAKAPAQKGGRK
ncbi:MAG: hypothetical protein IJ702_07120 [Fretibacterium sp.]|nr:hypothetical protein [Fretibacterium sp.]